MAPKSGQYLTEDEIREYAAYHNNQITPPEKFDGVVVDNTTPGGPVYRWQTAEEAKAGEDAAKAALKAVEAEQEISDKVRAEAAKRGVDVPPAPAPPPVVPVAPGS